MQFLFRSPGRGYLLILSLGYYSRIIGGIASACDHVTMLRACVLMCGFADVLFMPDCSVYSAYITCFGAPGYETCWNGDLLNNSKFLNVQIMLLEM